MKPKQRAFLALALSSLTAFAGCSSYRSQRYPFENTEKLTRHSLRERILHEDAEIQARNTEEDFYEDYIEGKTKPKVHIGPYIANNLRTYFEGKNYDGLAKAVSFVEKAFSGFGTLLGKIRLRADSDEVGIYIRRDY